MTDLKLFWGEIHTHTNLSDGNGDPEDNFELAHRTLDFWAMADHAYDPVVFSKDYRKEGEGRRILNDEWPLVQDLCRRYEEPGRFVPFLAYEWTHFSAGHHNVYYYDYNQPIRMPPTLRELYQVLSDVEALVIPHHVGYPVGACGKDWDVHDDRLSPFVEIFSVHGACEKPDTIELPPAKGSWMGPGSTGGSIQEALARGYKLGIMASSDSHAGHPGYYGWGLMAVRAEELTRRALWEAWRERRIYGVTGDRIELEFSLNDMPMGSVIKQPTESRALRIRARGWDLIDRIDILKNNRPIFSSTGAEGRPSSRMRGKDVVRFRVEWINSKLMHAGPHSGESRQWRGSLEVQGGRIMKALPCFRGPVESNMDSRVDFSPGECRWSSQVYTATNRPQDCAESLLFEMECSPETRANLSLDCEGRSKSVELSLADILSRSHVHFFGDISGAKDGSHWRKIGEGKFKVHRGAVLEDLTEEIEFTDSGRDEPRAPKGAFDFYYVRVTQRNGQRAWSSPIWVRAR